MKKILTVGVLCICTNSLSAMNSTKCADFSGSFEQISCTGQDAGEALESFDVAQESCQNLVMFGDEVIVDNSWHTIDNEMTYLASWSSADQGHFKALSIKVKQEFVGIIADQSFEFVEDDNLNQTLTTNVSRTFAGVTEILSTCNYVKK